MGFDLHNMSLNRSIMAVHRRLPSASAKPQIVSAHLPPQASSDSQIRRSANYKPTSWNYEFLQSFKVNDINNDKLYKGRVTMLEKNLKLKLASMKMEEDVTDGLELIDDIQRLGFAHGFENDIREALGRFLDNGGCHAMANRYYSVHDVALGFRLLRQNGYHVSQDVFKEFVKVYNDDWDVKDMLSLYEASYLAHEGEDILDEARERTTNYLNNFLLQTNSIDENTTVREVVRRSLECPLHRRMEMLEARWYIESYHKIKVANPALVELATSEFNMAQSVLQCDLKNVSRWWNSLGLAKELIFSRDRLVECFFWTVGMMFQPQFSSCRKGLTKVASFVTTIDDIYDVYGTMDELELFTNAVERWDINAVDTLPDYMKACFLAFHNTVNELSYEALDTHGHNILPHLTKVWTDMLKAFLKEAEWSHVAAAPPTFSEYMENAWRSVSGTVIMVHTYCLMNHDNYSFSKEDLESRLMSYEKVLRWPSVIFRLCNDLATSSVQRDSERGDGERSIVLHERERSQRREGKEALEHHDRPSLEEYESRVVVIIITTH
ncbi:Probable terpene synthase 12 [Linum grandiflorum]